MHRPIFNSGVKIFGDHMKNDYDNNHNEIIEKWSPIIESIFDGLDFNQIDKKLLSFYFEWLSKYDIHNTEQQIYDELSSNINSFKKLLIDFINSPEMNLPIINKVYNPFLKRERYEVEKNGKKIIIDETSMSEDSFFIELYPIIFLEAIGMKQFIRNKKLNSLLHDTKQ